MLKPINFAKGAGTILVSGIVIANTGWLSRHFPNQSAVVLGSALFVGLSYGVGYIFENWKKKESEVAISEDQVQS
jgi:hypothetical protein